MTGGLAAQRNGSGRRAAHTAPRIEAKALKRFLTCLSGREAPVLLDLGPVAGPNVAFFGERLGCRIFVEDLYEDLDRLARTGTWDQLPDFLSARFDRPSESIDGILCWDLFDHLDKPGADTLAHELGRILKPGGALLAFFATTHDASSGYGRFIVLDDTTLQYTPLASTAGQSRQPDAPAVFRRRHVRPNREIDRLFHGLHVSQSFLLRAHMRAMLFRKALPADRAMAAPIPARRVQSTVIRPTPAAASLKLAVGRVSAGVRRSLATPSPVVNGVEKPAHESPPHPLKAKARAE